MKMDKKNFFSTEFGRQTLAGILILISFPVIYCGINFSMEILAYLGMALIVAGMGLSPVMMLVSRKK